MKLSDLRQKYRRARYKSKQARTKRKRRHWKKRARFWLAKLRHRRKLRKARQQAQPEFQPWMANGANWRDASHEARDFIARAVVHGGLTCTSMARDYVPVGGSYTSLHLIRNGGRAGDAAGSRTAMVDFQWSEYWRNRGKDVELFGPDNILCLKHGLPAPQPEGSPNENLHDSHVHGGFYA